jgi:hypothetical protein
MFRLYPDFDPETLEIPISDNVLDELLECGFREVIEDWLQDVPERDLPKSVVKWFRQNLTQGSSVENVVRAIYYNNWKFVVNSPQFARSLVNNQLTNQDGIPIVPASVI